MLKTISAAVLAVSVLAAPAFAAGSGKTTEAPAAKAAKTTEAPAIKAAKTSQAPVIKAEQVKKPSVLNANARMGHRKHFRHHRSHKHMSAVKSHQFSKVTNKHVAPATKRG